MTQNEFWLWNKNHKPLVGWRHLLASLRRPSNLCIQSNRFIRHRSIRWTCGCAYSLLL